MFSSAMHKSSNLFLFLTFLSLFLIFQMVLSEDSSDSTASHSISNSESISNIYDTRDIDFVQTYRSELYPDAWERCYKEEKLFFDFLSEKSKENRDFYIFKGRKILFSLENDLNTLQISQLIEILQRIEGESSTNLAAIYCTSMLDSFKDNCIHSIPRLLQQRDYKLPRNLKRKIENMVKGFVGRKRISAAQLFELANKDWNKYCNLWTNAWYDPVVYKMEDEEVYEGSEYAAEYEKWKKEKLSQPADKNESQTKSERHEIEDL